MLDDTDPIFWYQVSYLEEVSSSELISRYENVFASNKAEACHLVRSMFSCRRIEITECKRV